MTIRDLNLAINSGTAAAAAIAVIAVSLKRACSGGLMLILGSAAEIQRSLSCLSEQIRSVLRAAIKRLIYSYIDEEGRGCGRYVTLFTED